MRHLIPMLSFGLLLAACAPHANTLPTATIAAAIATRTDAPMPTIVPTATPVMPTDVVPSPNGQFIARLWHSGVYNMPDERPTIDILNKDGSLLWQIPYQGEVATFMPSPVLQIYAWSPDSADLYFFYVFSPDGGDFAFLWTGYDLQKIHVADGHIERVLPGEGMMSFAFSPDGKQIAYSGVEKPPKFLYVRNLLTGAEKRAPVATSPSDNLMVGDIHWSPYGKSLAFQTQDSDYMVQTIYLDIAHMKTRVIREYKLYEMWFEGWTSNGNLRFYQYQKVVAIDPSSGQTIIIGTPTPQP